eukprot:1195336-Prorocentrum_minimum.AAC.4
MSPLKFFDQGWFQYAVLLFLWFMATWILLTYGMLIRAIQGPDAETELINAWGLALAIELVRTHPSISRISLPMVTGAMRQILYPPLRTVQPDSQSVVGAEAPWQGGLGESSLSTTQSRTLGLCRRTLFVEPSHTNGEARRRCGSEVNHSNIISNLRIPMRNRDGGSFHLAALGFAIRDAILLRAFVYGLCAFAIASSCFQRRNRRPMRF